MNATDPAAGWVRTPSYGVGRRSVSRGQEITFRDFNGRRRRGRFIEHVRNGRRTWLTVAELDRRTGKSQRVRSIRPAQIETVHRTKAGQ